MKEFENLENPQTLTLAIVDTIPEPFFVLDDSFLVMTGTVAVAIALPATSRVQEMLASGVISKSKDTSSTSWPSGGRSISRWRPSWSGCL